ncbi:hypothetical protein LPH50_03625 [Xylella taiwanensis]|uniref:Uncharacterized protein n=1 Tax=Xylella taiwanensis TaxID=1444770 RepID=A0ABS8TUI9_9GAMM|nr:hypothetical protein [Xylella taiwanensis]MCD8466361.1 hypothetical protein [Xylella taiwanensis]MCD8469344.1 hypothetical protein [Xylella taiwanensis]MCD8472563.1 hypothetical protein [Xylella taiwanensis]UFM94373.1 hypothetical protein LPH39_03630 [Xylella taiwanensis]UFN02951.1 hypothetical protein LPH43_03690 [Xylella taiwanensis]
MPFKLDTEPHYVIDDVPTVSAIANFTDKRLHTSSARIVTMDTVQFLDQLPCRPDINDQGTHA